LDDSLVYRQVGTEGTLLATTALNHSLWEYYKRRLTQNPWLIGSIALDAGPVVLAHIGENTLKSGERVNVFSHTDASQQAVLVAVAASTDMSTPMARRNIVAGMALDVPAHKEGGL